MTEATAGPRDRLPETRKPSHRESARLPRAKPRRRKRTGDQAQRAAEQRQLRARHLSELAQAKATTAAMQTNIAARAKAETAARFGHQWALLMQRPDAPDFVAKVAALEAEQAAAMSARLEELSLIVRAQRTASRTWLTDRQRRERAALRMKWQGRGPGKLAPFAVDDWEAEIVRGWTRMLFHQSAKRLTRRAGVRLVVKRKPAPAVPARHRHR